MYQRIKTVLLGIMIIGFILVIAGVSGTKRGQIVWADDCQLTGAQWTCTFDESVNVLAADWLHVFDAE